MNPPPLTIALLGVGSSEHITRLAADLAKRGHHVHIITEDRYGPFPALAGVTFHSYSWNKRFPARVADIRGILNSIRPDVLHSHYINIGGYLGVATGFHPHIITGWGSDVYVVPHYSKSQWLKTAIVLRSADWVLSPARAMQAKMNTIAGALPHNDVLPWGLDTHHFAPRSDGKAFRRAHGLNAGAPLALSARALDPIYNQDVLLRAWPAVLDAFPNARLALLRFNSNLAYEAELRALANELGISNSIAWLESLSFDELPSVYSTSDLIVSIPTSDAPALTVMEAMSCGTLVVVSDIPALHELVTQGEHGFLVDVKNPAAVAAAIRKGFSLPLEERAKVAKNNRATIVRTAERQMCLARLEAIYSGAGGKAGFNITTSLRNLVLGAS